MTKPTPFSIQDPRYLSILDIALTLDATGRLAAWNFVLAIWPDVKMDFDDFDFDIEMYSSGKVFM